MNTPAQIVTPNTWEFLRDAMITPTGFREYDARWKYPEEINLIFRASLHWDLALARR